jgi:hypothetical protein
MTSNTQNNVPQQLAERKWVSRNYLRSLSPLEKIAKLVDLQEQYYQMLVIREQNGGRPIPQKWRKWRAARLHDKI